MSKDRLSVEQKRNLKRIKQNLERFSTPILLFLLILAAVTPVIAVINLAPVTKPLAENIDGASVLGVTYDKGEFGAELVSGTHRVIQLENLSQVDNVYSYSASLQPYEAGNYSKPILRLYNRTDSTLKYKFIPEEFPTGAEFGLIYKGFKYVISDQDGIEDVRELIVEPGATEVIYLNVYNKESTNFKTTLKFSIRIFDIDGNIPVVDSATELSESATN